MIIWGYILGGVTLLGAIITIAALLNGRATRKMLRELLKDEARQNRELIKEMARQNRELIIEEGRLNREILERQERMLEQLSQQHNTMIQQHNTMIELLRTSSNPKKKRGKNFKD